ncbi:shikimate kinase 3, chloroplastic-like [Ananas comosus]|uniref:shikimate kinase n=1 Tax=Ananas comosus TaxID=4615 RepID=A0A6P5ED64_ANACO|nr:shikimate kinase 3, chloroplastic-like [Ananas comosus]XP_020104983.1 shikimate kinase 3, chloroplastic-like [Ananas comosus]
MESGTALRLQSSPWIGCENPRRNPLGFLVLPRGCGGDRLNTLNSSRDSRLGKGLDRNRNRHWHVELKISCCSTKSGTSAKVSEKFHAAVDEALILKRKSEDVASHLNSRCIYLVGMMGSGKTTVGKILSEVLGYSFFDSDKLVEQAVGVSSVAQIFKDYSEAFFRDNESNVLKDLSSMRRLVVATGGGAVIRPINWKYMRQGVTVWLDVPLEALARRIAAVGTASRPLLHQEPGDPYTKALIRLSTLSEERKDAYANAHVRICLRNIAAKKSHGDVSLLTPTDIAIEVLSKIQTLLLEEVSTEKFFVPSDLNHGDNLEEMYCL